MSPEIQFILLLAALILFLVEFVRGLPGYNLIALGLALWVTVPMWNAAEQAF